MNEYSKILKLNNEIEASIMEDILNEEGIPHLIVSYHSLAYDGIFQLEAWGHIEAHPEDGVKIRKIYQEILNNIKESQE